MNLHVHFHTLVLDGVLAFVPQPPPTDAEVAAVLATIRRRIGRLLARRGLAEPVEEGMARDVTAELSPVLAMARSLPVYVTDSRAKKSIVKTKLGPSLRAIAVRLCMQAQPAQTLVFSSVVELCGSRHFTDVGEVTLKGFPQPVRAHAVLESA